jgi:hypothetical protein
VKHKVPEELVVSKRLAVAIMGPDGLTLSEAKEKELLNSLGVVIQPMEFILGEVAAAQVVSSKVAMNLLGLHRTRETIYVDRAVQGYIWYVHMDMPYLGEDVDALQHKLWRDTQVCVQCTCATMLSEGVDLVQDAARYGTVKC